MNKESVNRHPKAAHAEKLRAALSNDVHSILSVCIHQFEDGKEIEETCFDVDGIVAGRLPQPRMLHERRIKAAPLHTREIYISQKLSTPRRGNFIPRPREKQAPLFSFA